MTTIMISDISKEAASKAKGILLKEQLKNLIEQRENDICVDFSGISRFASPFFNNSFAALALIYGFSTISSIKISNLSEVGRDTYQTSMANAKAVSQNQTHINEINQIIVYITHFNSKKKGKKYDYYRDGTLSECVQKETC